MPCLMAFEACILRTPISRMLIAKTYIASGCLTLGTLPLSVSYLFASKASLEWVLLKITTLKVLI